MNGDYEQTNYGSYVANITKAEATDDTTLVLTVDKPSPIMENLAVYILPEHIWKDIDGKEVRSYENEPTDGQPIVGAGPYVLIDREKGQFIRFKANPNYYGGAPAVDELTFRVYKNGDAVAQALRKGEIDFADELQANVFDAIKDEPGITAVNAAYYGFNEIGMNVGAALADGTPIGDGNPALKDKRVRQAINHAIDRQTLVDKVAVYGTPGSTIIPPLYAALHLAAHHALRLRPGQGRRSCSTRPATPSGADGKRVGPDGKPLTLRLLGRQESQTSQQTVQFVEGWLEEIGITVDTTIVTEDTLIELNGEGRFDLFEWGWVVEPDPDYQLSTFTCAQRSSKEDGTIYAGLSDSHFCNEEYDQLYAEQALETDPAKRAEIVKAMQQIVYDEAPYAITFYYDLLQAYRSDKFTNFVQQPKDSGPLLFQFGTWSYQSITPVGADDEPGGGILHRHRREPGPARWARRARGRRDRRGRAGRPAPVVRRGHRVGMGSAVEAAATPADPDRQRGCRAPVPGDEPGDAVRAAVGRLRAGDAGLRGGLQLLPVPDAARRPDRALHPWAQRRTRADRQAARRARQADRRAVPDLHLQPVRVDHQLRPVQPAGVGAHRRPDRVDVAAGRAPRSCWPRSSAR